MEYRLRASQQQFSIMLDFMETNGDLSKPQPGAQGKLKAERLWNELTELLNSVGGSAVQKQADKWKRVWSDWKTKTKKKASTINKNNQGTGGGPSTVRPLNPLEERILRIIGIGSIIGNQEVPEAGFVLPLPPPASSHHSTRRIELPAEETWLTEESTLPISEIPHGPSTSQNPEIPRVVSTNPTLEESRIPEPCHIEILNTGVTSTAPVSSNMEIPEDAQRLPSPYSPPTPRRRRRSSIGQRRRQHSTPFQQATREFVRIEEGRLRLEEMRMTREHEREMARIRVESDRNEILQKEHEREMEKIRVESERNEILQKIVDNIEKFLTRDKQ